MEDDSFLSGPPKTMFTFGLVSGIAIAAIFGMLFFTGGGTSTSAPSVVVADNTAPTAAPTPAPSAALPEVTKDDWVRGDLSKAKVVLVEYSDYECPFCGQHHPNMVQAAEEYGDDVAWVLRHFPLSFHPAALPSANAAECVGKLAGNDAFWDFSDVMFENQTVLTADLFESTATSLGVNLAKFQDCVSKKTYQAKITSDQSGGQAAGVTGTPATFVNGRLVSGAVPYATLKQMIESQL